MPTTPTEKFLSVDDNMTPNERESNEISSRRTSFYTTSAATTTSLDKPVKSADVGKSTATAPPRPTPSFGAMFSLLSIRQLFLLVVPGTLLSILSGGLAPFMTFVIGQSFEAFATFSNTPLSDDSKKDLLKTVALSAVELLGLAFGSFLLSVLQSRAWIQIGETITLTLRSLVYTSISNKPMSWFDTQLGSAGSDVATGSASLMTLLLRESDEVRTATSLASGFLIQHLCTVVACLVLAFQRSPILSLVILSILPIITIVQAVVQFFVNPLLGQESKETTQAASVVDRSIVGIVTVKGFNAVAQEEAAFAKVLAQHQNTISKLAALWGTGFGLGQFTTFAMFVQAFWFGGKMVAEGKILAGDVMAIFWACFIALNNIQLCMPQLMLIGKGTNAFASVMALVDSTAEVGSRRPSGFSPSYCGGELNLVNVDFAYPSRPSVPVLSDVTIFIPGQETTFVIGDSGSGKSTVAQLLLSMYNPDMGAVTIDRQDLQGLDQHWVRKHIAGTTQTGVVFDLTVMENVALGVVGMGRSPQNVTLAEVQDVCTAALLHDVVRDLPQGYNTKLGPKGTLLSGGQIQRLEIARALLRDPDVLILDEATSALDITSRLLVFQAIRKRRINKTTVVITHDLAQIDGQDFVYFLKDGCVTEQGYRSDLEQSDGDFRRLMLESADVTSQSPDSSLDTIETTTGSTQPSFADLRAAISPNFSKHASVAAPRPRPLTISNWMEDVRGDNAMPPHLYFPHRGAEPANSNMHRRSFMRAVRAKSFMPLRRSSTAEDLHDPARESVAEASVLTRSGAYATSRRAPQGTVVRRQWNTIDTTSASTLPSESPATDDTPRQPLGKFLRSMYRDLLHPVFFIIGLLMSTASGAMTPIFSFLLARLMFEVSVGAPSMTMINMYGGLALGAATVDAIFAGSKFFIMEVVGITWIAQVQQLAFKLILKQEKAWFDDSKNSSAKIVHTLVQDADDARDVPAFFGRALAVMAIFGVGLIWAMTQGWQLTLAGLAIAPIFATVMVFQTKSSSAQEIKHQAAKESVATTVYDTITNIRAIRSMGLDGVLSDKFSQATNDAFRAGVRSGSLEGLAHGCTNGLIYLAEAILFYVGAVLLANGTYTYLQMIQTLNLVIFTITVGSQLFVLANRLTRSFEAAHSVNRMALLPTDGLESKGAQRPKSMASFGLHNVTFRYPHREEEPVLKGIDVQVTEGEHVAVVGASGCGKSTIAALLQRLYVPTKGLVSIGGQDISVLDVEHLRRRVTVVSQKEHLFEGTIQDNIAYGNPHLTSSDIQAAAEQAHLHDFISSLPDGYSTVLGESGTQLSGGQAQRVQIARGLTRNSDILVLDECTSALDPATQESVCKSIHNARCNRTTLWITHKLSVMQGCDRILVLDGGKVVEDGSYEDLMQAKGTFMKLANGGEWVY